MSKKCLSISNTFFNVFNFFHWSSGARLISFKLTVYLNRLFLYVHFYLLFFAVRGAVFCQDSGGSRLTRFNSMYFFCLCWSLRYRLSGVFCFSNVSPHFICEVKKAFYTSPDFFIGRCEKNKCIRRRQTF